MTTHLLGLRAENFKRLTLADVTFDEAGGVVAVMGANEAGKSSLLDALEVAIAGRKGPKIARPVHAGEESARVIATFDDIVVTRTYKASGATSIDVKAADGRRVAAAEDLLRSLYSHVALDPLAFSRLSDADQVATLLPLIGFDPTPLDQEKAETFELRTVVNRDVKAYEARLEVMPDDLGLPSEEVSIAALSERLEAGVRVNNGIRVLSERIAGAQMAIDDFEPQLAELEARAARIREQIAERQAEIREGTLELATVAEVDIDPIRDQIADAEAMNARIRSQGARRELHRELVAARTHSEELTATLADIAKRRQDALKKAKMPVPGLSIDEDEGVLTLAGVPFSQASTGVKIRTGTAIAMALNPELRLIVIRDASLLDEGNRKIIDELAKANGFLVLAEIADTNAPVGVVIEEGRVKEVRK